MTLAQFAYASLGALALVVTAVAGMLAKHLPRYWQTVIELKSAQAQAERARVATWASDQATAAAEDAGHRQGLRGAAKLELAQRTAEQLARDPLSSVPPAVVQASVTRLRASMAAPSSAAPPAIVVPPLPPPAAIPREEWEGP